MAKLLKLHAAAEDLAKNAPEVIANPGAAQGLEQALVQALIACIAAPELQKDSVARHRHQAIMRRFRTVLEARCDQAIYISEICMAIGVQERTLRTCCQDYLGMSPKQFLTRRRMHLVRRALQDDKTATRTVTHIATQFGFWELGRFAVAYKSLFGESPSVTLQRSAL
jgi:AraC-like DNA-binding protein